MPPSVLRCNTASAVQGTVADQICQEETNSANAGGSSAAVRPAPQAEPLPVGERTETASIAHGATDIDALQPTNSDCPPLGSIAGDAANMPHSFPALRLQTNYFFTFNRM
jgi:hypothetical protein